MALRKTAFVGAPLSAANSGCRKKAERRSGPAPGKLPEGLPRPLLPEFTTGRRFRDTGFPVNPPSIAGENRLKTDGFNDGIPSEGVFNAVICIREGTHSCAHDDARLPGSGKTDIGQTQPEGF